MSTKSEQAMSCLWCEGEFQPRASGGSGQRFCSKDCRQEYHRACRIWADRVVTAGLLPASALRVAPEQHIRSLQSHLAPRANSSAPKAVARPDGALAPELGAVVRAMVIG